MLGTESQLLNCFVFAIAGSSDFVQLANSVLLVVFNTSSMNGSRHCIDIGIIDDSRVEEDEQFIALMTALSPDVIVEPLATISTIIDNDGKGNYIIFSHFFT